MPTDALAQNRISAKSVIPNHPRVLMLKGEEQEILKRISVDSSMASIHRIIIKECNDILRQPVAERILEGRRLLKVSREAYRKIFFLSYGWRTTRNPDYFKRAEEELMAVCGFTDWNPNHFLDVAEMTTAVAIGYDCFYDWLPILSKNLIRKSILEKGLKPSLIAKNNAWLTATTNWNQVCNAGMTLGALAIFEDEPALCSEIINRAIASIKLPMKEYGLDGNYPEGFGYWSYGTTYNVYFLDALQKAFGTDFGLTATSGFMKTPYYMLNLIGPSGLGFNYSDNAANGNVSPAMFWFASRLSDPSILYAERKYLKVNKKLHRVRELPALMIWGARINMPAIVEPKQNVWVGQGVNPIATLRSSWKTDKSIFIALKAGSPSVNHGHMDVGEFIFDALGERWAMDFDPEDYGSLEAKGLHIWNKEQTADRWKVFRMNNHSHSTLTINGKHQLVKGFAPIVHSSSKPDFLNAITDLTDVYKNEVKKAERGVAIVGSEYVLIQDELEAGILPAKVAWKMLTSAQIKLINTTTVELLQNNKKITLHLKAPKSAVFKVWQTKPSNDYEDENLGTQMLGFEFSIAPGERASSSVIISPSNSTDFNKIKIIPLIDWPKQ